VSVSRASYPISGSPPAPCGRSSTRRPNRPTSSSRRGAALGWWSPTSMASVAGWWVWTGPPGRSCRRRGRPSVSSSPPATSPTFRSGRRRFDRVISLGAVEHIEEGAGEALLEHARVLRSGGSMLITVPRLGPVKRWNDFLNLSLRGRTSYRSRGRFVTRVGRPPPKGSSFHQYEYPVDSFRRLLEQAGFEVRWIRPFMVGQGLGESGLVRRLAKRRHRTSAGAPSDTEPDGSEHSYPAPPPSAGPGLTGFLREAMLYERGRGASGAALTRLSQWLFGHMQVALAVKPGSGGPSGS
jgi:SAM-dependent methyltransferase